METERFNQIVEDGRSKLQALFSPAIGALGGQPVAYNAYFKGTEVVVLGYHWQDGEHTNTKPIAILVDPEVFDHLRVDQESGRTDGDGVPQPPLLE